MARPHTAGQSAAAPRSLRQQLVQLATALAVLLAVAAALDNGLGQRPGMGWNSDYCVNCSNSANGFQNEAFIRSLAAYINSSGLQKLGYRYVNMDASDIKGNLRPDPKLWPSGLKSTVDYVHSLGLGFGLYGDRGTMDCARNPGNLGHEQKDADFYASMEIDWYKSDSCFASADHDTAFAEYGKMRDALNSTGRPIWFALCGWNPWYAPVGKSLGNSWRTGQDTVCGWDCILSNVENALPLGAYTGPSAHGGGWNDLCLLLTPGFGKGDGVMSNDRHRTQFNLWSVMGANLLMTGNLSALNSFVLETWSNAEVIAVNQDPLGQPYKRLDRPALGYTQATVQECGGEPALQAWRFNAPATGFLSNRQTAECLNVDDCKTEIIYDGCTTTGGTCAGKGKFLNEQWAFSGTQWRTQLPSQQCVQVTGDLTLELAQCDPQNQKQHWSYNSTTGEIVTADGLCVTAQGAPAPLANTTLVVGRPVQNGAWAVVFMNDRASTTPAPVTCDSSCFQAMDLLGEKLVVRDLWAHEDIDTITGGSYAPLVAGRGGSRFLLFKKQTAP